MDPNTPDPWARVAELRAVCARELERHAAARARHRELADQVEAAHAEGRIVDLRPLADELDEMIAATAAHGAAWHELLELEVQLLGAA